MQIYWKDLTESKQKEILETFGDNLNMDVIPLEFEVESDEDHRNWPTDLSPKEVL